MNKTDQAHRGRVRALLAGLALALGATGFTQAHAAVILNAGNSDCSGNEGPSNPAVLSAFMGAGCAGMSLTELYKAEVDDGKEEGTFKDDYTTTFDPAADPTNAWVRWDGPPADFINPAEYTDLWGLAKDGNSTPKWYAWDLTATGGLDAGGWDGMEDLHFEDLWTGGPGAISHVSIFAKRGSTNVPEPSVLGLLGIGIAGIGVSLARRRRGDH